MDLAIPDPLTIESASRMLGEKRDSQLATPLMVVDLDSSTQALSTPVCSPYVIVGLSRSECPPPASGVDVALSVHANAPAPWVGRRLDGDLRIIAEMVRRQPQAALVLVQVLRATEEADVETGLLVESLAYSTLQCGAEFRRWLTTRSVRARAPSPLEVVEVHRIKDHLTITLNRPDVHNSYNAMMRDALCEALMLAQEDDTIRRVSLRGAGPSFCSGGDLTEFGSFTDSSSAHLIRTANSPARYLSALAARVTCHLHGACIGSGIELPAFAAKVCATADTRIRLPEVAMGLIPGAGGTVSIPRRIGRHRTAWLGLTGDSVGAATALAWGLVDTLE